MHAQEANQETVHDVVGRDTADALLQHGGTGLKERLVDQVSEAEDTSDDPSDGKHHEEGVTQSRLVGVTSQFGSLEPRRFKKTMTVSTNKRIKSINQ